MAEYKVRTFQVYNMDKDVGIVSILFPDHVEKDTDCILECKCGQYAFIDDKSEKTCPFCETTFNHFAES